MITQKSYLGKVDLTIILAFLSIFMSGLIPNKLINERVFVLLNGILLNPIISKHIVFDPYDIYSLYCLWRKASFRKIT